MENVNNAQINLDPMDLLKKLKAYVPLSSVRTFVLGQMLDGILIQININNSKLELVVMKGETVLMSKVI